MLKLSFSLSVIWVKCTFLVLGKDLRSLRPHELQFNLVGGGFVITTYTFTCLGYFI